MKQLDVTLLGQGYRLGCPDGAEAQLQSAVAALDQEMTGIRDAGKVKSRERIAVLAALNFAFQLAQPRGAEGDLSPPTGLAEAAAAGAGSPPPADTASAAEITRLIRRLDNALGDDGQLL